MEKKLLCLILLFVVFVDAFSQEFLGPADGNFGGVLSVINQPASSIDNRYSFDFLLLGGDFAGENNAFHVERKNPFFNLNFTGMARNMTRDGHRKYAYGEQDIVFLAFLFKIDPKSALSIVPRLRAVGNVKYISEDFAHQAMDRFEEMRESPATIFGQKGYVTGLAWQELGINYSRIVKDDKWSTVKVGATPKLLMGLAAGYAKVDDYDFGFDAQGQHFVSNIDYSMGFSDNINNVSTDSYQFDLPNSWGWGLDLGVRIEKKRLNKRCPTYQGTKIPLLKPKDMPYQYRLDFTLKDIGGIYFKASPYSADHNRTLNDSIIFNYADKFDGVDDFESIVDTLRTILDQENNVSGFHMGKPMHMTANIDYNFGNGFYVNAGVLIDLQKVNWNDHEANKMTTLMLTPRWESAILGAYVPLQVNVNGNADIGLGLRVGPVILGVYDLSPVLGNGTIDDGGFYFAFKHFFIPKKKKMGDLPCPRHLSN
ncbi:DUF5723 family protein [Aureibacter tunicatorum]|uniref:DUF5723 domain-containing protein n=1 Tax=Aureibacter tunicatorum TaxID=866807 RepID=A0AAE3XMX8_9BACT|nr:DUF5723 family protein [Aureibacter tunicatorum]MDR6238845.1 hypothetical protein [Aureibacter tunicatorum]BDD05228.1 hypothetical protein AUTU_27110 [Aureibacter tunicatorum]